MEDKTNKPAPAKAVLTMTVKVQLEQSEALDELFQILEQAEATDEKKESFAEGPWQNMSYFEGSVPRPVPMTESFIDQLEESQTIHLDPNSPRTPIHKRMRSKSVPTSVKRDQLSSSGVDYPSLRGRRGQYMRTPISATEDLDAVSMPDLYESSFRVRTPHHQPHFAIYRDPSLAASSQRQDFSSIPTDSRFGKQVAESTRQPSRFVIYKDPDVTPSSFRRSHLSSKFGEPVAESTRHQPRFVIYRDQKPYLSSIWAEPAFVDPVAESTRHRPQFVVYSGSDLTISQSQPQSRFAIYEDPSRTQSSRQATNSRVPYVSSIRADPSGARRRCRKGTYDDTDPSMFPDLSRSRPRIHESTTSGESARNESTTTGTELFKPIFKLLNRISRQMATLDSSKSYSSNRNDIDSGRTRN